MRIRSVEWSKDVREKVESRHGLAQLEVESAAFERQAWIKRAGSDRYLLLGRATSGAYVALVFAFEQGIARVITARRMDQKERRIYQRRGK